MGPPLPVIRGAPALAAAACLLAVALSGCFAPFGGCGAPPLRFTINNLSNATVVATLGVDSAAGQTIFNRTYTIPAGNDASSGDVTPQRGVYRARVFVDDARQAAADVRVEPCYFGVSVSVTDTEVTFAQLVS